MPRASHHGLFAALRGRDFRLLMAGYSVSTAGSWAYNVALTVYVYERTHSATWAGLVTIGRFLPSVLFGSYGGVVAERFEQVRLMVTLDLSCTLLMAALTVVAAGHGPALLAIGIGGANSVLATAYQPAIAAVTPQLVNEDQLAAANTLRNTVDNLAVVAGPALGAVLLVIGGPTFVFAANAFSYFLSAFAISRISARSAAVDVTSGGSVGPLRQMLVGARTILASRTATVLCAYSVIASFVYGVDTVLLVIVSEDRLGTGANGYGYLLAGLGVGGILAAGLVNRISARPRLGTPILIAMAVFCLPTVSLVLVHEPAVAFVVEVVRGGGTLVVDVLAITSLQRCLPRDKLGRVFGAFFTVALAAILLGALITPLVLSAAGLLTTLWLAGGLVPVVCLAGWPWLRRMDDSNITTLNEIAPRVALLQRAAILAESSRPVLEQLARGSATLYVGAGDDVVRQGGHADAFYVVERGAMRVWSTSGGAEHELATLGPDDYFGEVGLIHQVPRTATVTAVVPSRVLRVGGPAFLEALSSGMASTSLLEGARARLAGAQAYLAAPPAAPGTARPAPA